MVIKTILTKTDEVIENVFEASLENQILKYQEENTLVSFNLETNKMVRENEEYILKLHFKNKQKTVSILKLKENNAEFQFDTKTNYLEKNTDEIVIEYTLNDELMNFTIIFLGGSDDNE